SVLWNALRRQQSERRLLPRQPPVLSLADRDSGRLECDSAPLPGGRVYVSLPASGRRSSCGRHRGRYRLRLLQLAGLLAVATDVSLHLLLAAPCPAGSASSL